MNVHMVSVSRKMSAPSWLACLSSLSFLFSPLFLSTLYDSLINNDNHHSSSQLSRYTRLRFALSASVHGPWPMPIGRTCSHDTRKKMSLSTCACQCDVSVLCVLRVCWYVLVCRCLCVVQCWCGVVVSVVWCSKTRCPVHTGFKKRDV